MPGASLKMAAQRIQLPPRPPFVSHQSSSVPSTPYQSAREFQSRSRSPSPHTQLGGGHSPRSVKSEAGYMGTLPRGNPRCKYETAPQMGKRRVQYDIGDEILPKAKEEPKKFLDPDEEGKLSGDMRELYDRLSPTPESEERRRKLVGKLDKILRKEWPGNDFTVHVFGSSENLLCTTESDVDICIQTSFKKIESMHMLASAMDSNGMERVVCIASAKVPIVKIWDPELQLSCDINVNNTLAIENTRMIKTYVLIDERVRPLAMVVKHWAKQRILNDAGIGGTLSSYTWICMILNFLQTRDPPILPALHQWPHETYTASDGSESGFNDDLEALRGFGKANVETPAQLLFHFFRKYGHEVDYEKSVISVRHGKLLQRSEKGWHTGNPGSWRLCVEEPFNTSRNLGNTADMTAWKGIHLEIRRAFDCLARGDLKKFCEHFEYPPETDHKTFQKPASGPRPIAVQLPHGRRNAPHSVTIRAPRSQQAGRSGPGYRRSSSGASFAHMRPPISYPSQYQFANQEAYFQRQADLTTQIEMLKAQLQQTQQSNMQQPAVQQNSMQQNAHNVMAQAQMQAHIMHQQAQLHAHAHAHVHGGVATPHSQTFAHGPPTPQPYDVGRGQQAFVNGYGYQYPSPYELAQPMSLSASQEGTRTNPSSPSLSTVSPAGRRGQQRSASNTGSRSQSQPARALPNHVLMATGYPPMPAYDANTLAYVAQQMNGIDPNPAAMADLPLRSARAMSVADTPSSSGSPREYLGYCVEDSPQMQHPYQQQLQMKPKYAHFHLPPIPSYGEMRRQRAGKEASLQAPPSIATRRASRSPSPLGHMRSYSAAATGLRSAPLPSMPTPLPHRLDTLAPPEIKGPLIVNGSTYSASPPRPWDIPSELEQSQDEPNDMIANQFAAADVGAPHMQSNYEVFGIYQQPPANTSETSVPDFEGQPSTSNATPQRKVNGALAETPKHHNGPVIASSTPVLASEPFPALPPSMTESASASQENQVPAAATPESTTPAQKSPWRNVASGKSPVPPLDLSKSTLDTSKAPNSGQLLSPVIETRTPSPTANRHGVAPAEKPAKVNGGTPVANGTYVEAWRSHLSANSSAKQDSPVAKKDNEPPTQKTETGGQKSPAPSSQHTQQESGQWTQATQKRRRRRAKSGASKSGEASASTAGKGEPMPANESDRKGG